MSSRCGKFKEMLKNEACVRKKNAHKTITKNESAFFPKNGEERAKRVIL